MRRPQYALLGAILVLAGTLAYACGDEDKSVFRPLDETADGAAGAEDVGAFGTDKDAAVDGSGKPTGSDGGFVDTCGGKPCANHTGSKDFVQPDAPAGAPGVFGGGTPAPTGTDPGNEPAVVYPSHETMFPINVSHIRHEWTPGGANDLFRLRFEGPKTIVNVYTTKTSWEPTEEEWDWIAESNRGGSVKLTVSALATASPASIWQSKASTLLFSASEVEGAIYYWSTGSKGIMKAVVSDRIPVKFYTDPGAPDGSECVACHTLSRDGKRLAVGYGGEKLKEVSVPGRAAIVPATGNPTRESGWTTFSPDGKLLLVASKGVLTLIDADTGATVGPGNGIVPLAGKLATHPDWSALGDRVVVSLATRAGNKEVEKGSIAIIPYMGGTWGTPTVIVPAGAGNDNNFFPVFSPDSKWIAYVNANEGSKDAITAQIMLVPAVGGTPVALPRLNRRVNNVDGVTSVGNSMPTWAPSTQPGLFWLGFSSLRAYASLRPPNKSLDQIWIAGIDTKLPEPGYSAFWAPFQSLPEGNHRAFWTHVPGEKQCRCVEICGDGIDNDCDGVADEAPCEVCLAEEICGNGKDDNCDCIVDNNCGVVDPK